jgi:hypothetical protein
MNTLARPGGLARPMACGRPPLAPKRACFAHGRPALPLGARPLVRSPAAGEVQVGLKHGDSRPRGRHWGKARRWGRHMSRRAWFCPDTPLLPSPLLSPKPHLQTAWRHKQRRRRRCRRAQAAPHWRRGRRQSRARTRPLRPHGGPLCVVARSSDCIGAHRVRGFGV